MLALAQSAGANEGLFTASEHGDAETIGTLIAAGPIRTQARRTVTLPCTPLHTTVILRRLTL